MGLFDENSNDNAKSKKRNKDKKDVFSLFGAPDKLSYEEQINKNNERINDNLEKMGQTKRNKMYIRLTVAAVLFMLFIFITMFIFSFQDLTKDNTNGIKTEITNTNSNSTTTKTKASITWENKDRLNWLSSSDLENLTNSFQTWIEGTTQADVKKVYVYVTDESNITNVFYVQLATNYKYVKCKLNTAGQWEFEQIEETPTEAVQKSQADVAQKIEESQKQNTTESTSFRLTGNKIKNKLDNTVIEKLKIEAPKYYESKGYSIAANKIIYFPSTLKEENNNLTFVIQGETDSTTLATNVVYAKSTGDITFEIKQDVAK